MTKCYLKSGSYKLSEWERRQASKELRRICDGYGLEYAILVREIQKKPNHPPVEKSPIIRYK